MAYRPRGTLARTLYNKIHNDQYLEGYDMKLVSEGINCGLILPKSIGLSVLISVVYFDETFTRKISKEIFAF